MFSGLVQCTGRIKSIEEHASGLKVAITCGFKNYEIGESIAVDGVCLTVIEFGKDYFYCDVSLVTHAITLFSCYQINDEVNLERALKYGDSIGGHFVSGHCDALAQIKSITKNQQYLEINIEVPNDLCAYLVRKGSVAINGVSLTINELTKNGFVAMLIPHTLSHTNLSNLQNGSLVNLECDQFAKNIVTQVKLYMHQNIGEYNHA